MTEGVRFFILENREELLRARHKIRCLLSEKQDANALIERLHNDYIVAKHEKVIWLDRNVESTGACAVYKCCMYVSVYVLADYVYFANVLKLRLLRMLLKVPFALL